MQIRAPRLTELERLREIERDAGRAFGGRRIGAALIGHLSGSAARDGRRWVTLTTFRDVPWNAPYYSRLGFTTIHLSEHGEELAVLMEAEASRVPGDLPRVAMRRAT